MERRGHRSSLQHCDGIRTFGGDDFDAFADAFNFRRTDENHFQWSFAEGGIVMVAGRSGEEFAFANRTVDLASIGVAADADVERSKPGLMRVLDLVGQQDRSGASLAGCL